MAGENCTHLFSSKSGADCIFGLTLEDTGYIAIQQARLACRGRTAEHAGHAHNDRLWRKVQDPPTLCCPSKTTFTSTRAIRVPWTADCHDEHGTMKSPVKNSKRRGLHVLLIEIVFQHGTDIGTSCGTTMVSKSRRITAGLASQLQCGSLADTDEVTGYPGSPT